MQLAAASDPILRQRAAEVVSFDEELRRLADSMLDVMYTAGGVGLAANQVGVLTRLIVVDPSAGEDASKCLIMVNPEAVQCSDELEEATEGCLSLPGERYRVTRPSRVLARWTSLNGLPHAEELTGFAARIFLHEVAHLDGELISDVGVPA